MTMISYAEAFAQGRTFPEFLHATTEQRDLWHSIARRARPDPGEVVRASQLPARWKLLVLAEDWCLDAVNILPVAAALAQAAGIDLRIIGRDAFPELIERHLTGTSRSIPVFVLLDESGQSRGWWGPRPSSFQEWVLREGHALPKEDRYRELRRRYAQDRGAAVVHELVDLLWCAATDERSQYEGNRPCDALAPAVAAAIA